MSASEILPPGEPPVAPPPGERQLPFLRRIQPVTFAVFSLFAIFILYQVVAGAATILLFSGRVTTNNAELVRWSTVIGQILFILLPTVILVFLRTSHPDDYFRIRLPRIGEIIVTLIGMFALQQMLQVYMMAQDAIPLPPPIQHYVDIVKNLVEETYRVLVTAHTPGEFAVVVFSVALVPAIAEEMLFRGLVQRSMEKAVGGFGGAMITGVIFGAYHLNPFSIVPLVALGAYFGFIVYRSNNITLSMSAHFFNNFVACAAVYLNFSDDFVAVAPSGHPTSAAVMVNFAVFTVVFVAATYYFIRMTDHGEKE